MSRKLLIQIHMYLSAFFAPAVLLVTVSGGLYLLGIKGEVVLKQIYVGSEMAIDKKSPTLKTDVVDLLSVAGVAGYSFEYVKVKGNKLYTRPTSDAHYIITLNPDNVLVEHAQPSLQNRMVELHKGHGPTAFKSFQQFFAGALLLIILSGLWLGIAAKHLRLATALTATTGAVVLILLI